MVGLRFAQVFVSSSLSQAAQLRVHIHCMYMCAIHMFFHVYVHVILCTCTCMVWVCSLIPSYLHVTFTMYVYLQEVIAFQQDTSPDVRKFVVQFMEDAWYVQRMYISVHVGTRMYCFVCCAMRVYPTGIPVSLGGMGVKTKVDPIRIGTEIHV